MEKIYFSYSDIHQTVQKLGTLIKESGYSPDVMVAIGTGGFIPARILKTFLKLPILTVGLRYYNTENQPMEAPQKIQWIDEVEKKLQGRKILLVDEVDDSRTTLAYCLDELLKHEPAEIAVAVLHTKIKEKKKEFPKGITHVFSGLDLEDKWICYPWDAQDILEHEHLAQKSLSASE
ncbi:MAG: phosphoribosyltransferase [Spirochaetales bacterium]|nr:phosphoribosyltransferase [Spirochaetales bacterium]